MGAFANYDRTFMNVHHVKAMLGMSAEQETYKQIGAVRKMGPLYPVPIWSTWMYGLTVPTMKPTVDKVHGDSFLILPA